MKCPCCIEEIPDEAMVCHVCKRDIYLIKPFQLRVAELEQKVRELEEKLAAGTAAEAPAPTVEPEVISTNIPETIPEAPMTAAMRAFEFGLVWMLPLGLLLAAHFFVSVVFELGVVWLRIVSLMIPLPFGLILMNRRKCHFGIWALVSFVLAGVAVLGMSAITGGVDGTAVLPEDARERREFAEYAASIGLSYLTGMVLGRMLWDRRQSAASDETGHGVAHKLVAIVSKGHESTAKIKETVQQINDLGSSLIAMATTVASIYMGLKGILG